MNVGMFYKGVRALITLAALLVATSATAMTVPVGQVVRLEQSHELYRVVGAKVVKDQVEVTLVDLKSGHQVTFFAEDADSFDAIPGLYPYVVPTPSSIPYN